MSLGPPFDDSGERLQLTVGASTVVAITLAVFLALLASARTLGETITLRVQLRSPGALRPGGAVHLGGEPIGEIVAIRDRRLSRRAGLGAPGDATDAEAAMMLDAPVEVEARVLRSRQGDLRRNSSYFAWSPNVLTEAVLEVGPPLDGAAPGPPISDGERLRGQDPPEIGQLLGRLHRSLLVIKQVADELGPDWTELRDTLRTLDRHASEVLGVGQPARIVAQAVAAADSARGLRATLGATDAGPRVLAQVRALSDLADRVAPDLATAALQLGAVEDRLSALATTLGPAERQRFLDTIALLRGALLIFAQLAEDGQALFEYVERGRGTIGGFSQDIQIFDELKETHRLLKRESWRLLMKGARDRGQRDVR